jgi:hypothetical protein
MGQGSCVAASVASMRPVSADGCIDPEAPSAGVSRQALPWFFRQYSRGLGGRQGSTWPRGPLWASWASAGPLRGRTGGSVTALVPPGGHLPPHFRSCSPRRAQTGRASRLQRVPGAAEGCGTGSRPEGRRPSHDHRLWRPVIRLLYAGPTALDAAEQPSRSRKAAGAQPLPGRSPPAREGSVRRAGPPAWNKALARLHLFRPGEDDYA